MKHSVQSDRRLEKLSSPRSPGAERSRLRFVVYGVGALLALLTLAYIDGGEEPLHPIVQSISAATASERQS